MKYARALPLVAMLLGFVQLQCLLIPDDTRHGDLVSNQRPSVRITAGAATADTSGVDYKVNFRWNGIDSDGVVSLYQFAVDDTISEEAWQDTTGFSAVLRFQASTQDLEDPSGVRFTDWHTFYIRAVDNENMVSRSDKRFFNARTIAPTSEITFPSNLGSIPRLQQTLVVRWDGEDLDSSDPERKPVAWEYKLVPVRNIVTDPPAVIVDSLLQANNLLLDTLRIGDKRQWISAPAEQREVRLSNLSPGSELAFGVRALDEAGAREPSLERNRNFIAFVVRADRGTPNVRVTEPSLGSQTFGIDPEPWELSVPSGRELRFEWEGDASFYGSLPGNSNYALDIPDPEDDSIRDPNGVGGWVGWGTWQGVQQPIVFGPEDAGTTHNFWIKMRDISDARESERRCQIQIFVVPFTFEREVLILDDSKFSTLPPNDAQHDAFLETFLLRRFGDFGDLDSYSMYGDPEGSTPRGAENLELSLLARYQHLVWHSQASAGVSNQPLYTVEVRNGFLSSYLSAGGRLFMTGGRLGSFLSGQPVGNFSYPKGHPDDTEAEVTYDKDTFIWKFMRMRNVLVSVPTSGQRSVVEASGLIGLRSQHPAYPDIGIDPSKRDPLEIVGIGDQRQFRGGIKDWEGVKGDFRPIEQFAGLDTLYTPVTMDTTFLFGERFADLDDAVVGWRYESTRADTLAGTQQGRTLVLDFQPYWFDGLQVLDAGTSAINWLRTGKDH